MTFEVTFLADGSAPSETLILDALDIMEMNAGYANQPARQAAILAFVNSTSETWVDVFGKNKAYWRRLKDNPLATDEHLPSNTSEPF